MAPLKIEARFSIRSTNDTDFRSKDLWVVYILGVKKRCSCPVMVLGRCQVGATRGYGVVEPT